MRISDWSSDVCSSDLVGQDRLDLPLAQDILESRHIALIARHDPRRTFPGHLDQLFIRVVPGVAGSIMGWGGHAAVGFARAPIRLAFQVHPMTARTVIGIRSEERRVGKECVSTFISRWSRYH